MFALFITPPVSHASDVTAHAKIHIQHPAVVTAVVVDTTPEFNAILLMAPEPDIVYTCIVFGKETTENPIKFVVPALVTHPLLSHQKLIAQETKSIISRKQKPPLRC